MSAPQVARPLDITADALGPIAHARDHATGIVSVSLRLERAVEKAAQHNMTAWRDHRRRLAGEGASERALAAIDDVVPDAHHDGPSLVAFADGDGLLHRSVHGPVLTREEVRLGPLPSLVPLVGLRQRQVPHVCARIDRVAAEIEAVDRDVVHHFDRDPRDAPPGVLRRTKPGGWSQRRYQQRAENVWADHGRQFAAAIEEAVDDVRARFVALAGDEREVAMTLDALSAGVRQLVVEVPGSRHADGSDDEFAAAVAGLTEAAAEQDTEEALATLIEEAGQDDRAAVGVADVFAALQLAQVQRLLVTDDAPDERVAWFAAPSGMVALEAATLEDLGADVPVPAPLTDVAVHAALATGASVRVVPSGSLVDRCAALLRYA
jgi:hypothetical protein